MPGRILLLLRVFPESTRKIPQSISMRRELVRPVIPFLDGGDISRIWPRTCGVFKIPRHLEDLSFSADLFRRLPLRHENSRWIVRDAFISEER